MLTIGDLDRRIIVQSFTNETNKFGEVIKTYNTLYTLWAKMDWKKSDRAEDSQEFVQNTDIVFYVRNMSDVTILSNYRIKVDGEDPTYIIHGIKEIDGRDRFLEIETKLKDNDLTL